MKVFSHSVNTLRRNPHTHYQIFCLPLTLTYPLLSNIHLIHHLLLLNLQQINLLLPRQEVLHPVTEPSPTNLLVRRLSRTSNPPSWLQDYVTESQANHSITAQDRPNGTRYPMHHFLSNSRFSSTHSAYIANITTTKEPHTYAQAIFDPNWQKVMDEELFALQLNQMWTLILLPVGQKPIRCKWVYKIKYNSDGSVDKYKARLVAKGYT